MVQIEALPAFKDNYIWAITNDDQSCCAVVDPGDARVVRHYLKENQLQLTAILLTHHHWDHTGGAKALAEEFNTPVYGPIDSPFVGITHPVNNDDQVTLPECSLTFRVMAIPGHTLDHIAYYSKPLLFCGDTLFAAGCGRLFEGSAEQMYNSLSRLQQLDDDTLIYCAHEYTLANLEFAQGVEPENVAIRNRLEKTQKIRAMHQPSLPTSLAEERCTNPFLRCNEARLIESVQQQAPDCGNSPIDIFAALRAWKDRF